MSFNLAVTYYRVFPVLQNQTVFVRDDSYQLNAMEVHQDLNSSYILWLKTPKGMDPDLESEDKVWVPLLPGYSILTKKNKFIQLSINIKNDTELQYTLDNFEADHTFTNLKETKHYDYMFTTLRDELKIKEKLSIPSLLGFDNAENVIYLCAKVIEKYPSLINFPAPVDVDDEDNNPKILAAKKTNERATKAMKCKGNEISNTALEKNVQKGVHINPNGLQLYPKSTQALLVSNNGNVLELYQARRQIKKLKNKLESTCSSERDKVEEDDNNSNTNHLESKKELENTVNKIIDDNNLGTTIFMSTENYLKLLLTFPCKQCGESKVSCKRWEVKAWGLYLNVAIYCRICKYSTEFTNEPDCMSYSKTLAATGLIAGLNRRELETGLAFMGITSRSNN